MKVYRFRCGICGYESGNFEERAECEQMKEIHETACRKPATWVGKYEPPRPLPTEIIYV